MTTYHFVPILSAVETFGSWGSIATDLSLKSVEPSLGSLGSPRILNQHPLYFKQFQWRFNGATYNTSKVPMVNLHLKSLMKSFIMYNLIIFLRLIVTFLTWIKTYLMEIRIWKTFVASISTFMDTLFAVELEITPQQFIF